MSSYASPSDIAELIGDLVVLKTVIFTMLQHNPIANEAVLAEMLSGKLQRQTASAIMLQDNICDVPAMTALANKINIACDEWIKITTTLKSS